MTPAAAPILLSENAGVFKNGTAQVWLNNAGAFVGTVNEWDPENSTVLFTKTVDGSGGKLALNATTGAITVAGSVANASSTLPSPSPARARSAVPPGRSACRRRR